MCSAAVVWLDELVAVVADGGKVIVDTRLLHERLLRPIVSDLAVETRRRLARLKSLAVVILA